MTQDLIEDITIRHPIKILVHGLDDDTFVKAKAEEQFLLNNIHCQIFTEQEPFIEHLKDKPHICFIDYRLPGALNGLEITKIVTDADENCKVIMVSGVESFNVMWEFHNKCGGWRWVRKGQDYAFVNELVMVIQETIQFVKIRIEAQEAIEQLKESSRIRKRRKSLSDDALADV